MRRPLEKSSELPTLEASRKKRRRQGYFFECIFRVASWIDASIRAANMTKRKGMESHSSAADIESSGFEEENLGHSNVKGASISNDKDDSDHHDTEAKLNPLFEKKNALHSGISSSNAIGTIAMTLPEADAGGAPKRRLSTPSAIFSSEAGIQVRRRD